MFPVPIFLHVASATNEFFQINSYNPHFFLNNEQQSKVEL